MGVLERRDDSGRGDDGGRSRVSRLVDKRLRYGVFGALSTGCTTSTALAPEPSYPVPHSYPKRNARRPRTQVCLLCLRRDPGPHSVCRAGSRTAHPLRSRSVFWGTDNHYSTEGRCFPGHSRAVATRCKMPLSFCPHTSSRVHRHKSVKSRSSVLRNSA